jgi:serine protease Do
VNAVQTVTKEVTYVESGSIPDIVENVSPAIVMVKNYAETSSMGGFGVQPEESEMLQGTGSGVIISSDGYIVTNYHVVNGAARVTVMLSTYEEVNAEVIGGDQYVDLAVLKIDRSGLDHISFGDSKNVRAGELAIALGYPTPDPENIMKSKVTVTAGILSAVAVDVQNNGIHFEMLQTDAPINPGNSGGALVDGSGSLIGINSQKEIYAGTTEYGSTISAEGIGYAIPSHVVEPIVEQLKNYGEVIRPFIGISGRIVTQANSEYYKIPQGMYIDELTQNGPAEKAGVKVGDIITQVNDEEIITFEDLYSFIMSSEVGQKVKLTIYRSETEKNMEIEVTLASSIDY